STIRLQSRARLSQHPLDYFGTDFVEDTIDFFSDAQELVVCTDIQLRSGMGESAAISILIRPGRGGIVSVPTGAENILHYDAADSDSVTRHVTMTCSTENARRFYNALTKLTYGTDCTTKLECLSWNDLPSQPQITKLIQALVLADNERPNFDEISRLYGLDFQQGIDARKRFISDDLIPQNLRKPAITYCSYPTTLYPNPPYPAHICSRYLGRTRLSAQSGYAGIERWSKNFDLFKLDLVLVPITEGLHHSLAPDAWSCGIFVCKYAEAVLQTPLPDSGGKGSSYLKQGFPALQIDPLEELRHYACWLK
ncbi:hypothetical protein B484DRAFT_437978, partial [Ochromonadaceae sp. CCMP2298]